MLLQSGDYPAARRCSVSRGPSLLTIIRMLRSVSKKSLVPFFSPFDSRTPEVVEAPLGQSFHCCLIHPYSPACWCYFLAPSLYQPWGLIHIASGAEKWPSCFLGRCVRCWVIQLSSSTRVITLRPGAFGIGGPQRLPIWVYTEISWGNSCLEMEMNSCPLCHFFSFVTRPQPVPFLLSLVVLIRRTELKMRA